MGFDGSNNGYQSNKGIKIVTFGLCSSLKKMILLNKTTFKTTTLMMIQTYDGMMKRHVFKTVALETITTILGKSSPKIKISQKCDL